jgi:DNA repair protein RecO (recombination protein O)
MYWTDDGIVLAARKHGETSVILTLLTRGHGRHLGLVRGGVGRRARGLLLPGNRVRATWRARLAEHLGAFTCEPTAAVAAAVLGDRPRLAALSAACAVAATALPEREPHGRLYDGLGALLAALGGDGWAAEFVRFEVALLADLGFGLDLSRCAATGTTEGLAWVSPKTGRAVSAAAGEPYRRKLLPLPPFLLDPARAAGPGEVAEGLRLTAHFLERHVYAPHDRKLPPARVRIEDLFPLPTNG